MLRESAIAFGYHLNLTAIGDPSVAIGVPGGDELLRFVDALVTGCKADREDARTAIMDSLGPDCLVDAASVFGNFEMMNRVAEGTGIPVSPRAVERMKDTVELPDLDRLSTSSESH
ncbi:MAG: hypothetical protein QGM46_06040 [Actinomycetota bacterium]|nr:hypothetical protein [Actinomycetota bacterium]MDK1016105.1 hypothetical protein [Actinomycetota bacterium]MDK1038254.1 hypothetical protein [Actinomycetota bacterium]MDK1097020.1 hypothetical protein [Actinomycetota bacterium]MDK1102736.1 hypothetical protein [Actinomycetota bacterium]